MKKRRARSDGVLSRINYWHRPRHSEDNIDWNQTGYIFTRMLPLNRQLVRRVVCAPGSSRRIGDVRIKENP